jgi:ribA/ribD-fused uncharacterized protein
MTISSFSGNYKFLSNFWPCEIIFDGEWYASVEHAYVAAKITDPMVRQLVRKCLTAGEVKRLGRKLPLRCDWVNVRLEMMENFLRQKFAEETLGQLLLATGDEELVEGNYWNDTFWGICNGVGENNLGKLLMRIRADLSRSVS